ncbi:MAG TPA: cell division protein CrgA [Ilumatobacter sp.]|nr:cell division protein CrgA [Ilumatobacter sp.]
MAPPKRKTVGGRTTAKGTQPGDVRRVPATDDLGSVSASSRYTPPVSKQDKLPIPWIPYLMLALLGLGVVAIMLKNLVWQDSMWLTLVGLGCILGGLYTATKWR